jgi:hypothetical protein
MAGRSQKRQSDLTMVRSLTNSLTDGDKNQQFNSQMPKNHRLNFVRKGLSMKPMVLYPTPFTRYSGDFFTIFFRIFLAARARFSGWKVLVSRDAT